MELFTSMRDLAWRFLRADCQGGISRGDFLFSGRRVFSLIRMRYLYRDLKVFEMCDLKYCV